MTVGQGHSPRKGCPSIGQLCACIGVCKEPLNASLTDRPADHSVTEYETYKDFLRTLRFASKGKDEKVAKVMVPKKDPLYKVDDTVIATADGKSTPRTVIAQHYDSISECWLYVLGYKFPDGKQRILYQLYSEYSVSKA